MVRSREEVLREEDEDEDEEEEGSGGQVRGRAGSETTGWGGSEHKERNGRVRGRRGLGNSREGEVSTYSSHSR
jgi:hypothetical protein